MIDTKFKVGQVVYTVNDYKISKGRIEEVIIRQTDKMSVSYEIVSLAWESQGQTKKKIFTEAMIVETFEEAKEAALANWENIYRNVKTALGMLKEEVFEEEKKEYEEQS
jgi:hypothetical protein